MKTKVPGSKLTPLQSLSFPHALSNTCLVLNLPSVLTLRDPKPQVTYSGTCFLDS